MKKMLLAAVVGLSLVGLRPAEAVLIYDNGPINGYSGAFTINNGFSVSDSFAVSSPASLSSAIVGLWVGLGATPTSVQWSMGTTPFASDVSSGISSPVNTYLHTSSGTFSVYQSAFAVNGSLGVGTYWFTLHDAVGSDGTTVYWDRNYGPSGAQYSYPPHGTLTIDSESFQLYGAVPEPTTMIAGALLLLPFGVSTLRVQRKKQAA